MCVLPVHSSMIVSTTDDAVRMFLFYEHASRSSTFHWDFWRFFQSIISNLCHSRTNRLSVLILFQVCKMEKNVGQFHRTNALSERLCSELHIILHQNNPKYFNLIRMFLTCNRTECAYKRQMKDNKTQTFIINNINLKLMGFLCDY